MAKIQGLSGVSTQKPPLPSAFTPSPQQQAIYDFMSVGSGNLLIEARAGTGKTTTLIELCKQLRSGVVFLAYNKSISTEISRRLAAEGLSWKEARSATMHSIGFSAWKRHAPKTASNVRGEKLDILMDKLETPYQYRGFCKKLVSLAKQHLFGVQLPDQLSVPLDDDQAWLALIEHFDLMDDIPAGDEDLDEETYIEYALAWSLKLIRESIQSSLEIIDFDDMIYMPLYSNLRFWQYDYVLIDEAQDTNIARRVLAQRLLRPSGRLIAVGDRHQAIYGFTGASADALDLIAEDFGCKTLPLTVTYRCPQSVVRMAQQWVPDIEARPDAPEGLVAELDYARFLKLVPEPTDAILCRNTKPLVRLAFDYLRRHIPCYIEGKAIGAQLVGLCRKWKTPQTIGELTERLEEYLEAEREKLLSQHKEDKFQTLSDKVETLLVLANSLGFDQPIQDMIDLLNRMFKDDEGLNKQILTLSTIHKAKGREWDRVYFLGRQKLIPSVYAKQDWQLQQEFNLAYVGVTRAKSELIEVPLP